jgi:carboxylate-amine ligase
MTIGTELEFQIIDPNSFELISRSKDIIRNIKDRHYSKHITPEITQSMIEINTSIHSSVNEMYDELVDLQQYLLLQAKKLEITFCGGGTHPFSKWKMEKIFPTNRYKKISHEYRYLSKLSTVFGQHVHIGCKNGDDAIYLTHALSRYVPQFIAICASSPFYQGVDTGFFSSRTTDFNAFPLSGVIPYFLDWKEFSKYFYMMENLNIVTSMKDFYWDIRPKPEFGTVEIRVCDAPLTIFKSVMIVAYIQALSFYLLNTRPVKIIPDLYYFYNVNHFQACRYGYAGKIIDPHTKEKKSISEDIIATIKKIKKTANELNTTDYLSKILEDVINKKNDTILLRNIHKKFNSLPKLVEQQCQLWTTSI